VLFSKYNNAPIYTAGTVQSLKSMKVNFSHLPWPAQSPVLKTSERNRFPPPTSLKQLEDVPSGRMV
jgi:hypothetical protein